MAPKAASASLPTVTELPSASDAGFTRSNVPAATNVPPAYELLPLSTSVPGPQRVNASAADNWLTFPEITSAVPAFGVIQRLSAKTMFALIAWLPPVTLIAAPAVRLFNVSVPALPAEIV